MYTAIANPPRPADLVQQIGLSSMLLQSALLVGMVLLVIRHGRLPFGGMTAILGVNSALMSVLHDQYFLIPAALLAGIIADLLLWWLQPSGTRQSEFYLFAFAVPVIFYGLYYLTIQLTHGIGWTLPLWLGSIFIAGIAGLLVSFLVWSPLRTPGESAH